MKWVWKKNTNANWKLMLRDLWWHLLHPMSDEMCPWVQFQSDQYQSKSPNLSRSDPHQVIHVDRPIVGYRVFHLFDGGRRWDVTGKVVANGPVRLAPLNDSFGDWQPGVNVARHAVHGDFDFAAESSHVCPDPAHQCGFWILHDIKAAGTKDQWGVTSNWIPVIGAVQGWGRVQEHSDGYRVQYASVLALSLKPPTGVVVPAFLMPYSESILKQLCREWDVLYVEDYLRLPQETGHGQAR